MLSDFSVRRWALNLADDGPPRGWTLSNSVVVSDHIEPLADPNPPPMSAFSFLVDSRQLSQMSDPAAIIAAVASVVGVAWGVWSYMDQRRRVLAADRPLQDVTFRSIDGHTLVDMRSVRAPPGPLWSIVRIESLDPQHALLLRSEYTAAVGQPATTIDVAMRLPGDDSAPVPRFFVDFRGAATRATLRIHFRRDGGEAFTRKVAVVRKVG